MHVSLWFFFAVCIFLFMCAVGIHIPLITVLYFFVDVKVLGLHICSTFCACLLFLIIVLINFYFFLRYLLLYFFSGMKYLDPHICSTLYTYILITHIILFYLILYFLLISVFLRQCKLFGSSSVRYFPDLCIIFISLVRGLDFLCTSVISQLQFNF